mgnify:CR=1 FL=1
MYVKRYLCFFSLLFWFSFLHAQKRLERQLNRSIAKEAVFQGAQVSVSIFDLEQKKEVVSLQSDKKILPASTIKLSERTVSSTNVRCASLYKVSICTAKMSTALAISKTRSAQCHMLAVSASF